jgi:hypothetical protein
MKSFNITEKFEISIFFKEYGYVIIDDVLSKEDCVKTEKEIFRIYNVDKNKPSTYDNIKNATLSSNSIFSPQMLNNRQNKKIYDIFSMLLKETNLSVCHDTCYFLRPTKNIKFENNKILTIDKWRTPRKIILDNDPLHNTKIDNLNYMNNNNFLYETYNLNSDDCELLGIINITSNKPTDGGWSYIPNFDYNQLKNNINIENNSSKLFKFRNFSLRKTKKNSKHHKYILSDDLLDQLIKPHIKQGSIVIWDQRIPYCIEPNNSNNYWIGQRISYKKKINDNQRSNIIKNKINKDIRKEIKITDLGKKLFF